MAPTTRYRIEDGKACIDIRLRSVQQLFDQRDPAPFRERDLADDAFEYLQGAADDIPRDLKLKVIFWFAEPLDPAFWDNVVSSSVRAHLDYERDKRVRQVRLVLEHGQRIFWIGLSVLVVCLGLAELITVQERTQTFWRIVREGLVIGGWVAMWRPIEALLYDWWPIVHERRTIDRLIDAELSVRVETPPREG